MVLISVPFWIERFFCIQKEQLFPFSSTAFGWKEEHLVSLYRNKAFLLYQLGTIVPNCFILNTLVYYHQCDKQYRASSEKFEHAQTTQNIFGQVLNNSLKSAKKNNRYSGKLACLTLAFKFGHVAIIFLFNQMLSKK